MSDRHTQIEDFVSDAGWSAAERQPVSGDMSSRRYLRLSDAGATAILMDADAPMTAFVRMTRWLTKQGLTAPDILAADPDSGLILLEDFGNTSLKSILTGTPDLETELFEDCITILLTIRAAQPPELDQPDAVGLVEWTTLTDAHYPGISPKALHPLRERLCAVLSELLAEKATVSLRDFHSENMMWLPERHGHLRLGLLDYQDAFLTHPAYDLMSLLTDARTWISKELRTRVFDRYIERSGDDHTDFARAFAALSIQRNLRILGIFTRANRHLSAIPNTRRYLAEALEHPDFADLRDAALAALPPLEQQP